MEVRRWKSEDGSQKSEDGNKELKTLFLGLKKNKNGIQV